MVRGKKSIDLDNLMGEQEAYESRLSRSISNEGPTQRERIGIVEQFFDKIQVTAIKLNGALNVGDIIEIGTEEDAVRQKVESMQIDRKEVTEAHAGDSVGIKSKHRMDVGSPVYKVIR
ncbi:peptidase U32 [mine drainage metagenome]|uniref:Peptidase U32 n=1 Tax=mine drainage metagenome TaxID=410659 RepID=T0ZW77_9ZZZZ